ncbi:hypothetical protein BJ170DRAFT_685679 [Xylariales sp. AK1849]|nr:hypothetical protein BJ170DRAFT_685679 [Xylariales sp. AK1849]
MVHSQRSFSGVFLVAAFLFVLFLTSRHLGNLSPYYQGINQTQSQPPYEQLQIQQDISTNATTSAVATPTIDDGGGTPRPSVYDESCAWMPETSKILVIMKTGASESFDKVPTQLVTTLRCLADFLIFSDMRQKVAGVDIHDSLQTVLKEAMEGNSDFDLYRRQHECPVDQDNCNKESSVSSNAAGWSLDKYKNIHIAEMAYHMRPDYDWYITVDADTYVLWPNLVQWLGRMDPSEKRYLGSVTNVAGFPFAHGGSGYVISGAAMQDFAGNHSGVANKYDAKIKDVCCGDYMMSVALKDTINITVENVWPTINGEKPHTLPFGNWQWCHPIVTMHHMNSEEISSFWNFEQRFYQSQEQVPVAYRNPLLMKDIYEEFLASKLQDKREDWDNLCEDKYYLDPSAKEYADWQLYRVANKDDFSDAEKEAHKSFDNCRKMCEEVEECFQFRFQDGICAYQRSFLLGRPRKKESAEDQRWMSGWPVSKIRDWVKAHSDCEKILWPGV